MSEVIPTITKSGISAVWNSTSTGVDATIAYVSAGTGRYTPNQDQEALENEVGRWSVIDGERINGNQIYIYTQITGEGVDSDKLDQDGGFWVSEIGFHLEDGTMFAVYSVGENGAPTAYKASSVVLDVDYQLVLESLPSDSINVINTGIRFNPGLREDVDELKESNVSFSERLTDAELLITEQSDFTAEENEKISAAIVSNRLQVKKQSDDLTIAKNDIQVHERKIKENSDGLTIAKSRIADVEDGLAGQETENYKLSAATIANRLQIKEHSKKLSDDIQVHALKIKEVEEGKANASEVSAYSETLDGVAESTLNLALAISSALETEREFRREFGQDGVFRTKSAGNNDFTDFAGQPHDASYATLNHHNHWDHYAVNGLAQFSCVVAGVYIQFRHTDYERRRAADVGSEYMETTVIDYPDVPSDIASLPTVAEQVAKARQYFNAREDASIRSELADFAGAHQVYMTYVEVYPELQDASELETTTGSRHQLNAETVREMVGEYKFWSWTGMQDPLQNYSNFPLLAGLDEDGKIQFGVWKARVVTAHMGSYEDYPLHEICLDKEDFLTDARFNFADLSSTRLSPFEIEHIKLREMIKKIPGLDGYGANINNEFSANGTYKVDEFRNVGTTLNAAYYHDGYSLQQGDADGRTHRRTGFSRHSFVAMNTRPEIMPVNTGFNTRRISMMIPLELFVVDFRQKWNPHGIANVTDTENYAGNFNKGYSAGDPLPGYWESGVQFYKTPAELYGESSSSDPADTAVAHKYVTDQYGNPQACAPAGVPPSLPSIDGNEPLRQRYTIYEVYDQGTYAYREMRERFKYQYEIGNAATIKNTLDNYEQRQVIKEMENSVKKLTRAMISSDDAVAEKAAADLKEHVAANEAE